MLGTASSDAVLPQIMRKLERMGVKEFGGRARDADRLFVQPRRLLDLPDAGGGVHRAGDQHAAVARRSPAGARRLAADLEGRAWRARLGDRHPRRDAERGAGIPAIGLVLVLSVDWFIGMARAIGNLIGNCVATVVVAAWEGDLDRAKASLRARCRWDEPTGSTS